MADHQPDYNVYFERDDIDGALVGGASLKADEFSRLIAAAGTV